MLISVFIVVLSLMASFYAVLFCEIKTLQLIVLTEAVFCAILYVSIHYFFKYK